MRLVPRLLLTAGLLIMGGGLWLILSDAPAENAARVEALPRVAAADLARRSAGEAVLLEGRLVATSPAGPRDFVAFHRESFLRVESSGATKGQQVWQRTGTVRPAIAIESGGVTVAIANQDYRLDTWPHREQTDVVPRYSSMIDTTERFLGFKAGDLVTVDGRIGAAGASGAGVLHAEVLFGGSADAYLTSARSGSTTFAVVGAVFMALGLLLAAVATVWLRAMGRRGKGRASA